MKPAKIITTLLISVLMMTSAYADEDVFSPYKLKRNEVVFKDRHYPFSTIDPTINTNSSGSSFPGVRGANQMIIYTPAYGIRTGTNEYGTEATVQGNAVTLISGADSLIPLDGIVISGHGTSKNWLTTNINVGTKIYIDKESKVIHAYTTSDSFLFEAKLKVEEAKDMISFYRSNTKGYVSKTPNKYIDEAEDYIKKAQKDHDNIQKYSKLAIEAANSAIRTAVPYNNNEMRGVWVRPTEKTPQAIAQTIQKLKKAGVNTIILETYFHGKTIYPSNVMSYYGFTRQNETFAGFDPLDIWIKEAHKNGMKVHIWFETFYAGNKYPQGNNILAVHPDWGNKNKRNYIMGGPSPSLSEHNGYFLDPANPEVQAYLIKLLTEVISVYKPDGINLDYIRYPQSVAVSDMTAWGYTRYAREDFKQLYGVDPVSLKVSDPLWTDWCNYRQEKVTNMVRQVGNLGKQYGVYISAVIFPDRQAALDMKQQDWKTWTTNNYVDGFTPLFLTSDAHLASNMMRDLKSLKGPSTDLYAGLFITFMQGSEEDLVRQIHEARKADLKGVIIFDYAHFTNNYVDTLSLSAFKTDDKVYKSVTSAVQPEKKRKFWQRKTKKAE